MIRDESDSVCPLYVVVDTATTGSADLAQVRRERLNRIVPTLIDAALTDPILDEYLRVAVLLIDDEAEVAVPLTRLSEFDAIPTISTSDASNHGAAFHLLRREIANDIAEQKADHRKVFRPNVFLFTDGKPTDDASQRQAAFTALTDPQFRAHPNIVVIGFPGADSAYLLRYRHHRGVAIAMDRDDQLESLLTEVVRAQFMEYGRPPDECRSLLAGSELTIEAAPDDLWVIE